MKRINKKGFTMIEILAVIMIIGILITIIVPSVTKYIHNSKKDNYKSSLKNMVSTVNDEVIYDQIYDFDEETEYFIMPLVCVELEKGDSTKSTFGKYNPTYSFIIVEATENGYSYKVQSIDDKGYGTYLIKPEEIKIEEVDINKLSYITTTIQADGTKKYGIELKDYSPSNSSLVANVFVCDALEDSETNVPSEEEQIITLSSKILNDNEEQSDTGIDFSKISSDTNGKGLYYTSTNTEYNNVTYYFRGNVDNNYVKFGKDSSGNDILWRIVRINEDGSVRLVTQDSVETSKYNEKSNDNAWVGYMYGTPGSSTYALTHANTNPSTMKTFLDNWYVNNLSSYSSYLADAGFCNDRSVAPSAGLWHSGDTTLGYGKENTYYGVYNRNNLNQPQFKCSNDEKVENDLFTIQGSGNGNEKLEYPIGLLTADEVVYAGGKIQKSNSTMYLANGNDFWTMTPAFLQSNSITAVIGVDSQGKVGNFLTSVSYAVRPVINLKGDVKLSNDNPSGCTKQDGTEECPYIINTIYGDVNNDGVVNYSDITKLNAYLNNGGALLNEAAADVNVDGVINQTDLDILYDYYRKNITSLPVTE